ncbi:bifunctional peptidase and arginyl-hydroxylase JMJD5 isoform X2 [Rousettus aegyptiacus]|uniref:bifunctional peptidase and arginyl-hydroxylase JMJD5 isoform X2 n=1 Tax=Rousettus aegyptiacus TaxID=9407 RepID=UPI00168CBAAE|nr:bifunctional peptidase and arginyl-hydroxylase JMJD5 isoform X2 [Rousettus aegyptiacus]XP_036081525.1 bifunctional peptidase and arginyl-hydroxylase JMJD5 isoform X2 [Rousettus aegyptiacus]
MRQTCSCLGTGETDITCQTEQAVGLMAEDISRDALAGTGTLWAALRALLPGTKEELRLDLSERVERGVALLLRQATDLFYGGRRRECLQTSEVILDYSWERLNTGAWQDVDKDWRRVYSFGCLLKAMCLCEAPGDAASVATALNVCDMGLLMGAAIFGDILIKVAAVLQTHLPCGKRPARGPTQELPIMKKARAERAPSPDVTGGAVPRLHCPSLQHFREHFLLPQRPVILEGVVDHWPCMRKWSLEYIQEIAGCRTVPVEVGSRYTDEEWSQRLMTVSEFIGQYILNEGFECVLRLCGRVLIRHFHHFRGNRVLVTVAPTPLSPPAPGRHSSASCSCGFAVLDASHTWNHAVAVASGFPHRAPRAQGLSAPPRRRLPPRLGRVARPEWTGRGVPLCSSAEGRWGGVLFGDCKQRCRDFAGTRLRFSWVCASGGVTGPMPALFVLLRNCHTVSQSSHTIVSFPSSQSGRGWLPLRHWVAESVGRLTGSSLLAGKEGPR